jgi:hypothetical protein
MKIQPKSMVKPNFNLSFKFWILDKILEARRDFDEALSKLKGGRRKREADSDSVVIKRFINYPLF